MKNTQSITLNSVLTNPLFIIIMLLLALIIVLAIFRSVAPYLNLSVGASAHIGDLKGSLEIEAFSNDTQPTFIMYYAEWCGHCKRAKPEFTKLVEEYKGNIKVIMIDAEAPENADLVKSQNIQGFPTIRYYPSGLSGNFDEYNNERNYSNFVEYLGNVEGAPDTSSLTM
jgi:thiol-disulfide isomerase/thioredoxin